MREFDDPAEQRMYLAERKGAAVRIGVVLVATLAYGLLLLAGAAQGTFWHYAFLLGAWVYVLAVFLGKPYERFPIKPTSYFITANDSLFIALWVLITGGLDSPFFLLWYVEIAGVAFRYDYRSTLGAAVAYIAIYGAIGLLFGQLLPQFPWFLLRSGLILLIAMEVGLISEEAYQQAQANRRSLKELEAAHERLKELDEMKTRFVNAAAHELGTPLTPLKLQLQILKSPRTGPLTPAQEKTVAVMERNLDRLTRLIEDVLDVARYQAGRIAPHKAPMDLARTAVETVETFTAPAEEAGILLRHVAEGEEPLLVMGDAHRLSQVVFNLVHNAIKYTPKGGTVTVETRREGDSAVVRVRDSGVGLRSDQMERLFQPFTQVHDPSVQQAKGGTGLGLHISKGIVESHGGRIWVESDGPGQGTTFAFTLPTLADPTRP